jgi:hypothetical protein
VKTNPWIGEQALARGWQFVNEISVSIG